MNKKKENFFGDDIYIENDVIDELDKNNFYQEDEDEEENNQEDEFEIIIDENQDDENKIDHKKGEDFTCKNMDSYEKTNFIIDRAKNIESTNSSYLPAQMCEILKLKSAKDIATFEVEYAIQQIIDQRSNIKILEDDGIKNFNWPNQIQKKDNIYKLTDYKVFPDQGKFHKMYKEYRKNLKNFKK